MFARSCPQCGSSRVQRGFNDPPLLLRLIGIYDLLCNNCDLEFKGFALPGTIKRSRRAKIELGRGGAATSRRRAPRLQIRLPVKMHVFGSGEMFGDVQIMPVIRGYTRDVSEIGLASVFPSARFDDKHLTNAHRRLRLTIHLPQSEVQIYATAVRYELLDNGAADQGWLVGARITKISETDRAHLFSYLHLRR